MTLGALPVRAAGPGGVKLTADDVERAFHDCGIDTFLFHWLLMPAMAEGRRRLIRGGHRDELVVVAEMGLLTGGFVRPGWERHARTLGVDVIDIYLLGWVRARWYVSGKTWVEMSRLKEEGKVWAIGFSFHDRKLAASLARRRVLSVRAVASLGGDGVLRGQDTHRVSRVCRSRVGGSAR